MKGVIFLVNSLFIIGSLAAGVPGKCPKIDTAKDIQTGNMTGKWYSIYETGKEPSCVSHEFELVAPNLFLGYYYHLKQTIFFKPNNPENINEGFLVYSKFVPAMDKMTIVTFATDHEHYAGIYSCKEVGDVHFSHIGLWSRDMTMTDKKMRELKKILKKYKGVDLSDLKAVNHTGCYN